MTHKEKLKALRSLMKKEGIHGYIIPSSDPHISEYLPEHYKCISWTSGFTGSAGTLVVTEDFAGLWTDTRYFVQATDQLKDSGFELVKLKVQHAPEYVTWLGDNLKEGDVVAFDGNLASLAVANSVYALLEPKGIQINGHSDLLSPIWSDRKELPKEPIYTLPITTTGESAKDKISRVRKLLLEKGVDCHLISSLDDLAWLLNVRGSDVKCNPVTLGYVFINKTETILFTHLEKVSDLVKQELSSQGVVVQPYNDVQHFIQNLEGGLTILLDPKRTCYATFDAVPTDVLIKEDMNPSTLLKSIKNDIELGHERKAMINDGIALTKFFKWIEENVSTGELSEMSIGDYLRKLREEQPGFVDISFDTIAGYKDHGALPHYKAEEHSNYVLKAEGLLLVDSGGQYETGTTDITRVVSLGVPTLEEKEDYTLVLKGMIEGSIAVFPRGTRGYSIDAITRRPLWNTLRNYGHGTGHGVGFFLNVHEGPQVINPNPIDIALEEGMISSIEPGLYREGKYGIRIENLVLSKNFEQNEFGDFMHFETLTICYISTDLVNIALLNVEHIEWLNNYNKWVYDQLSPVLNEEERTWLKEKTKAI